MWDSPTKIDDRFGLSDSRTDLIGSVVERFDVPDRGVLIMLESEDLTADFNPRWHKAAVHMDIKTGGIEEMSPEHILKIMDEKKYRHFIWLSRQICEDTDLKLTWVLAHELGHLQENLIDPLLSKAGYFLFATIPHIDTDEPMLTLSLPSEMYAELAALSTARSLFTEEEVSAHLAHCRTETAVAGQCIDMLTEEELRGDFDLTNRTISFLERYRSQLQTIQPDFENDENIRTFNIQSAIAYLEQTKSGGQGL